MKTFWERVQEVFETSTQSEISREISKVFKVSQPTIGTWKDGTFPSAEALLAIRSIKKVSIDWLLTGEGVRDAFSVELLTTSQIESLKTLTDGNQSWEELAKLILSEGIEQRLRANPGAPMPDAFTEAMQKFILEAVDKAVNSAVAKATKPNAPQE